MQHTPMCPFFAPFFLLFFLRQLRPLINFSPFLRQSHGHCRFSWEVRGLSRHLVYAINSVSYSLKYAHTSISPRAPPRCLSILPQSNRKRSEFPPVRIGLFIIKFIDIFKSPTSLCPIIILINNTIPLTINLLYLQLVYVITLHRIHHHFLSGRCCHRKWSIVYLWPTIHMSVLIMNVAFSRSSNTIGLLTILIRRLIRRLWLLLQTITKYISPDSVKALIVGEAA